MKKRYLILLIIIFCIIFYKGSNNKELESSLIYNRISNYYKNGNLEQLADTTPFEEYSAEDYFFKGIKSYYNNQFIQAKEYFKRAQLKNKKDPIFNIYVNFFLNNCIYKLTGAGEPQRVKYILETTGKYPILANDIKFVRENISTILTNRDSRNVATFILQKYIDSVKSLEFSNKLRLKSYIAVFKMLNENYADSLYLFYEIISESDKIKNTNIKNSIKIKAYEYIAHMHFMLEDYETAIEKYNLAISLPIDNKFDDARAKYGAYTNRTASYIQLRNFETAKFYSKKTLEIIHFLPKELINGVEIFVYNNLARIAIYENQLKKAKNYLQICDTLLIDNNNVGILNNDMFVALSYAELYIAEQNFDKAEKILNEILIKNNDRQMGFESEIYSIQMELYEKTKEFDKYAHAHENLFRAKQNFNFQLRKNYLKFVEKSFVADQLKNQEKISHLKIKILIYTIFTIIAYIIFQIIKIIKLKKNNFIDQLTNVYNRKYLKQIFENLDKKNIKPLELGVFMIDIDYFKKYNDSYGHIKGDYVIKSVANILSSSIEKEDSVIRYGGEEFLLILKNKKSLIFENIYGKIFEKLEMKEILHEYSSVSKYVTLSIGGAKNIINNSSDLAKLIKNADSALYQAKEEGRNRFNFFKN